MANDCTPCHLERYRQRADRQDACEQQQGKYREGAPAKRDMVVVPELGQRPTYFLFGHLSTSLLLVGGKINESMNYHNADSCKGT